MSQADCLRILKKKNKWMSIKEIEKILGFNSGSANLVKLYKNGEVIRMKKRFKYANGYLYKIK